MAIFKNGILTARPLVQAPDQDGWAPGYVPARPLISLDDLPAGYPGAAVTQWGRSLVPPLRPDYLEIDVTRPPQTPAPAEQAFPQPVPAAQQFQRPPAPPIYPEAEAAPPGPAFVDSAPEVYPEIEITPADQTVPQPAPTVYPAADVTQWGNGFVPADWPETSRERLKRTPRAEAAVPSPEPPAPQLHPAADATWPAQAAAVPAPQAYPAADVTQAAQAVAVPTPQAYPAADITQTAAVPTPQAYPAADATQWGNGFVPADWDETPRERLRKAGAQLPPEPAVEAVPADNLFSVGAGQDAVDDLVPVDAAQDADDDLVPVDAAQDADDDLVPVDAAQDADDDLVPVDASQDADDDLVPVDAVQDADDELTPWPEIPEPVADENLPADLPGGDFAPQALAAAEDIDDPLEEELDARALEGQPLDIADGDLDLEPEEYPPGYEFQPPAGEYQAAEDIAPDFGPQPFPQPKEYRLPQFDDFEPAAEARELAPIEEYQAAEAAEDIAPDVEPQPFPQPEEYRLPQFDDFEPAVEAQELAPIEDYQAEDDIEDIVPDFEPHSLPQYGENPEAIEDLLPEPGPHPWARPDQYQARAGIEEIFPDLESPPFIRPAGAPSPDDGPDELRPVDDEEIFPSFEPHLLNEADDDEIAPVLDPEHLAEVRPDQAPSLEAHRLAAVYDDRVPPPAAPEKPWTPRPAPEKPWTPRPAPVASFWERISTVETLQLCAMASVIISVGFLIYSAVTSSRPSFMAPEGLRLMYLEYSLQALCLFLLAWLGPPRGPGRYVFLIGLGLVLPLIIAREMYDPVIMLLVWSVLAQLAAGTDSDWLREPRPLGPGRGQAFVVLDEIEPGRSSLSLAVFVLAALAAAVTAFYNFGSLSHQFALANGPDRSSGGLELAFILMAGSFWPAFMALSLTAIGRRRAVFVGLGALAAITFLLIDLGTEYALGGRSWAGPERLEYSMTLQLTVTRLLVWAALAAALVILLSHKLNLCWSRNKPLNFKLWLPACLALAGALTAGLVYWGEQGARVRVAPQALAEPLITVRMGELEFQLPEKMNAYNWRTSIRRPDGLAILTETAAPEGLTPEETFAQAVDDALKSRLAEEIKIDRNNMRLVASRYYDPTRPTADRVPNGLTLTLLVRQPGGHLKLIQSHNYDPRTLTAEGAMERFVFERADRLADWAGDYFAGYRWLGENAPAPESGFKTRLGLFSVRPEGLSLSAEFGRPRYSRLEVRLHDETARRNISRPPLPYENVINYYQGRVEDYRLRTVGGEIKAAELVSYPLPPSLLYGGWTRMSLETAPRAPLPLHLHMSSAERTRRDRDRPHLLGVWKELLTSLKVVPQGVPLGQGLGLDGLPRDPAPAPKAPAGNDPAKAKEEPAPAKEQPQAKEPAKAKQPAKTKSSGKNRSKRK